ncbi:MAG: hypothetical protein RL659_2366, partial [Pseudomonadota bacterium]
CLLANPGLPLHHCDHRSDHAFSAGSFVCALFAGPLMLRLSTARLPKTAFRFCAWVCGMVMAVFLSGCETTTMRPPQVDTVRFTPMPESKRVIAQPITGIPVTPTSRPMACAFWNVRRKECTVVTPLVTGYNYVGHELRHCFEGAFHD